MATIRGCLMLLTGWMLLSLAVAVAARAGNVVGTDWKGSLALMIALPVASLTAWTLGRRSPSVPCPSGGSAGFTDTIREEVKTETRVSPRFLLGITATAIVAAVSARASGSSLRAALFGAAGSEVAFVLVFAVLSGLHAAWARRIVTGLELPHSFGRRWTIIALNLIALLTLTLGSAISLSELRAEDELTGWWPMVVTLGIVAYAAGTAWSASQALQRTHVTVASVTVIALTAEVVMAALFAPSLADTSSKGDRFAEFLVLVLVFALLDPLRWWLRGRRSLGLSASHLPVAP
jgi:hypothetical protein